MKKRIASLRIVFLVTIIFLFLTSCVSKEEKRFVNKEQLSLKNKRYEITSFSRFFGDISYKATEIPIEYYITKNTPTYLNRDSVITSLKDNRIIAFEFEHVSKEDLLSSDFTNKSYAASVKYMASSIRKDFSIVTSSKDTILCSGVTFERNFKVAPFKRVLLYFSNIKSQEKIKLVYQDHLFGNGIIKFNLNQIPIEL